MKISREKLIEDLKAGWKHGDHKRIGDMVGITKTSVRQWYEGGFSEYEADILIAASKIQAERLRVPKKALKAARMFYAAKQLPTA